MIQKIFRKKVRLNNLIILHYLLLDAKYPKQPNKKQEWKRMLDSVWNLDQKIPQKLTMMEDFKNPRVKLNLVFFKVFLFRLN